jgi:serum/glucocorticoid-regulated kinase 2
LRHKWFAGVDFKAIVDRTLPPPYKPEPLKQNFDEEEFSKGDIEFRKQLISNLDKET